MFLILLFQDILYSRYFSGGGGGNFVVFVVYFAISIL